MVSMPIMTIAEVPLQTVVTSQTAKLTSTKEMPTTEPTQESETPSKMTEAQMDATPL